MSLFPDDITAPQQSRELHARMFARYLAHCTPADLAAILEADKECWHAQMNYGNRAQLEAQEKMRAVIDGIVSRMPAYALRYSDQMIADAKKV